MFWHRSEPPSRRPTPPIPTPDDDATEVHTDWANTLHRHLQAQRPTPFSPMPLPTTPRQTAAVEPLSAANADGFRHSSVPIPPPPQAHYQPPRFQGNDQTDIGAQLYHNIQQTPQQLQRTLEYYGDPNIKNILIVVGYQVHSSSHYGVEITENGPTLQRKIIPWHRVHALTAAEGDPILRNHYQ